MSRDILDQLETHGPDRCPAYSEAEAAEYVRRLAERHYENFTVASRLLPPAYRPAFHALYGFCRWADDLGDETGDPARSLELLAWWRRELDRCYAGSPRHPVFVALRPVIEACDIPRAPFEKLIAAFEQDQRVTRYETFDQVLAYCTGSADPVGRLVLYVCGYRDAAQQQCSDATCTALQLTNFWQDVRRDVLERGRVYMPRDVADRHGLDIETMVTVIRADAAGRDDGSSCAADRPSPGIRALQPAFRATLADLAARTWPLFTTGRELLPSLDPPIRRNIRLFTEGGEAVLRRIERAQFDTLRVRPTLGRPAKAWLLLRALVRSWWEPGPRTRARAGRGKAEVVR